MKKLIISLMLCLSTSVFANISKVQTQIIFNRLIKANHIQATLNFDKNNEKINAYGYPGHVVILGGLLKYADKDIMIYVLSHELGHATGHVSELEADRFSGRIGAAAGYNVCPGAKKLLLGIAIGGDGIHPNGDVRLKAICKSVIEK
jgi:hypothetical protein